MIAMDDMFRTEYTATLQRLAADTHATATGAIADTLLRSPRGDNPLTDVDELQYRPSPPYASLRADRVPITGTRRLPPRQRHANCNPPSGRLVWLHGGDRRHGHHTVPAVQLAQFPHPSRVALVEPSQDSRGHGADPQQRRKAAYSKGFLFIEGTADLDDEIEDMLRATLDEEPPAPGTVLHIRSWMLHFTLSLFDIAFELLSILLFDNADTLTSRSFAIIAASATTIPQPHRTKSRKPWKNYDKMIFRVHVHAHMISISESTRSSRYPGPAQTAS
jgi:hypothetical protein